MPSRQEHIKVTAADGGLFDAYLSVPYSGRGPGIILLQEIFGVNSHIRDVADRLADQGYTVLAPDLFWRIQPGIELGYDQADFAMGLSYARRFDLDQGIRDAGTALKHLRSLPEAAAKTAGLGFCLGGKLAYLFATRQHPDCAVAYYPVGLEQNLDEAANLDCPLLIHFAAEDQFVPPAARETVERALKGKKDTEIYTYEGVDHAFNNDARRESYNDQAATLAWQRTLAFLDKHLH